MQMLKLVSDPMPPVGGYSMHLYCRYENPDHPFYWMGEFIGQTASECKRDAKTKGWIFNSDRSMTCPICAKIEKRK